MEFFGCFVRGVVHGVCWRSLPGGGFLISPDHKFSGPSVTFLYPDCRWPPRKVLLVEKLALTPFVVSVLWQISAKWCFILQQEFYNNFLKLISSQKKLPLQCSALYAKLQQWKCFWKRPQEVSRLLVYRSTINRGTKVVKLLWDKSTCLPFFSKKYFALKARKL